MKKKSIDGLSGQLSRARLKEVAAGKYPQPPDCGACGCQYGSPGGYLNNGTCYCYGGGAVPDYPC